jgi:hypothetical protein
MLMVSIFPVSQKFLKILARLLICVQGFANVVFRYTHANVRFPPFSRILGLEVLKQNG